VRQELLLGHVGNTNSLPFQAFALVPLRVFENCWNHKTAPDLPHVADKAWSLHLFFPVQERIGKCAKSMYPAGIYSTCGDSRDIFPLLHPGIPNRSYRGGVVRALVQVQREAHLVVKRERALLLVQREAHLVVKRETVASISPSVPQIPSLKKSRRPEATLHLSTPLHTADPLVPMVPSTSYTKTMQQ